MTSPTKTAREIIRKHAERVGAYRYRILKTDEVNYYGRMPTSAEVGWYFVSWDANDWAKTIQADDEVRGKSFAEMIR